MAKATTILKQYPIGKQIILDLFAHDLSRPESSQPNKLLWTVENYYYLVGSRKKEIEAIILSSHLNQIKEEGERLGVKVYGALREQYRYLSTTQTGQKITPTGFYEHTLKLYHKKKPNLTELGDLRIYIYKFMDGCTIPNTTPAGMNMLDMVYENLRRA